jgi:peptidoglycan-associated lipoprotein
MNLHRGLVSPALLTASLLAGAGCAHNEPHPADATTVEVQAVPVTAAVVVQPSAGGVIVSRELATACGLDFNNVDSAPKFDFDQTLLSITDQNVLRQVATCVTTGSLAGRSLALVGRADPRGEGEYNMVLGANRASSAGNYLGMLGLGHDKVRETSRGKLDAVGTDEGGWSRDRRVDVLLQ